MKKKRIFMLSVMIDRMDDDMPFHMFNLIKHVTKLKTIYWNF